MGVGVKVMMFYGHVNFQHTTNGKAAWPWLLSSRFGLPQQSSTLTVSEEIHCQLSKCSEIFLGISHWRSCKLLIILIKKAFLQCYSLISPFFHTWPERTSEHNKYISAVAWTNRDEQPNKNHIQTRPRDSQHVPTRWLSTCPVATIPSRCQTGYAKYESRRWELMIKKKQKQIRIPLLVLLENDKMVQWITTAVCVCECEKPGPCIERGLPVGTMDATTPTPSPQPTSQRAFIWACTWVLQLCLAKRVCAPEQGSWVPSQNSPGTLAANPPTFLRQQPTRIKNKHSMNPIFFLTKSNKKKKIFQNK